jgi:hypothetical protein
MMRIDGIRDFIAANFDSIVQTLAVLSGMFAYAYKNTKKVHAGDLIVSSIFCLFAWSTLKMVVPVDWAGALPFITYLLGFFSKAIVEFLLKLVIILGRKAEEYVNKKLNKIIDDDIDSK